MTNRQARTERRAAERKAKKLARKAAQHRTPDPSQTPDPGPDSAGASRPSVSETIQISGTPETRTTPRAQINRANAQFSTGPRTPLGKLASSRNSLKHGLASAQIIIPGENRADFEALLAGLVAEHEPASLTEELLVRQVAESWWLTQRALRLQNDCFTPKGVDEKRLSLFLRYQTTYERAFHKALNTLIRLKKDRARGFVPQTGAEPERDAGFVSQNAPIEAPSPQLASPIDAPKPRWEERAA